MNHPNPEFLQTGNETVRGLTAADPKNQRLLESFGPLRIIEQSDKHVRRTRQVSHTFAFDQAPHLGGIKFAQANVGGPYGRYGPSVTPAIAVEHGQGPKIFGGRRRRTFDDLANRIQVSAAVNDHDSLGLAGGAAGVVQTEQLFLVPQRRRHGLGTSAGQELLVIHFAQRPGSASRKDIHDFS